MTSFSSFNHYNSPRKTRIASQRTNFSHCFISNQCFPMFYTFNHQVNLIKVQGNPRTHVIPIWSTQFFSQKLRFFPKTVRFSQICLISGFMAIVYTFPLQLKSKNIETDISNSICHDFKFSKPLLFPI